MRMGGDDETIGLIAGCRLLSQLPHAVMVALAAQADRRVVSAGETLYHEGDSSDSVAIVVVGRLAAIRQGVVVAEVVRGGVTGELGVLTDEPRAADIVAARDTSVLILPRQAVMDALSTDPGAALGAAAAVAEMIRRPAAPVRHESVVAISAASPSADPRAVADRLARQLNADVVVDSLAPDSLMNAIEAAEASSTLLLLVSTSQQPSPWRAACERQADVILRVVSSTDPAVALDPADRAELVVTHSAGRPPRNSAVWLARAPMARHHVRDGVPGDIARLARRLMGRSVGLALSGGGARALAHLGVYRALHEAGVAIDMVAGASIGAVAGIQIAELGDPDELIELNREAFVRADFAKRFTVPMLSVLSVRTALPLFENLFGDLDLADTIAPSLVSVANFSTCELLMQQTGSAALWARASASPPGLWPPVAINGELFVDGAVLDNLPVEALRQRGAARVLAITVSKAERLSVDARVGDVTSWKRLADPRPSKRVRGYPTLAQIVMRLGLLSSLPKQLNALAQADLTVEPDVAHLAMGDYKKSAQAIEAGYQGMQRALDQHGDELLRWSAVLK
jgi:NTE family protein